jgi:hypothetical protein
MPMFRIRLIVVHEVMEAGLRGYEFLWMFVSIKFLGTGKIFG